MPFKSGANVLFAQEGVPYFAIFPLKVKRAPEECNLGTGFSEERLAKPCKTTFGGGGCYTCSTVMLLSQCMVGIGWDGTDHRMG